MKLRLGIDCQWFFRPKPKLAQVRALRDLGLDRSQRRRFFLGESAVFTLGTGETQGIGLVQRRKRVIRSGIVSVSAAGHGLRVLSEFRERSETLARAFGLGTLELFGAEVINARLRAMLLRQGFEPKREVVPEALGGGTMEILSKRFIVRDIRRGER